MTHSHAATTVPEGATELQLVDQAAAADASCACCAIPDAAATSTAPAELDGLASAHYAVAGMTCGNCVRHVSAELAAIEGVEAVEVELVAGGVSTVTVRSSSPLADAAVAAAVEEAGYEVVPR
ncbi:heavy-metal-associated domain-containing protein [Agromyces sp. NPDC127015]|uniref:heavy-metal-associated domain-containing protein n=1 Tax=Agromyces sp. NPDC127015 TaxID=3347108 RepID=UPI00365CB4B4